jgi:hypothetical protein
MSNASGLKRRNGCRSSKVAQALARLICGAGGLRRSTLKDVLCCCKRSTMSRVQRPGSGTGRLGSGTGGLGSGTDRLGSGTGRVQESSSGDAQSPQRGNSGTSASSGLDTLQQLPSGQKRQGSSTRNSHAALSQTKQLPPQVSVDDHVTLDTASLSGSAQGAAAAAAPSSPRGMLGHTESKPRDQPRSKSIKAFLGQYRPSIARPGIEQRHSLDDDDKDAVQHDDHHDSPFFVAQPAHSAHNLHTVQEQGARGGHCWYVASRKRVIITAMYGLGQTPH